MIEMDLRRELDAVAERYRRRRLWSRLALCWLAFALVGTAFIAWSRVGGQSPAETAPVLGLLASVAAGATAVFAVRGARDIGWLARRIEGRFPELDARLLTAIGETRHRGAKLGFLQQTVVAEALAHARRNAWETIVSDRSLKAAKLAQTATLCGFVVVLGNLLYDRGSAAGRANLLPSSPLAARQPLAITVEPEDTSIERGTSLLVLARFDQRLPADVRLVYRKPDAEIGFVNMSKSLADPVFAGRVLSVNQDLTYAVHYDDQRTRWYKATVFDYPELLRADARLSFPEYTGMAETLVEDTRSITAVEGAKLTLIMRLNKPVAEARLDLNTPSSQPKAEAAAQSPTATAKSNDSLQLSVEPQDENTYTTSLVLKESRRYRLHLVDDAGRQNKLPPEIVINVTPNRPPEVKMAIPARDVQVSPLQELALQAQVYDDFGLRRFGVSYSMAGEAPQEIVLGESAAGKNRREADHTIAFEALNAEPDQLLSYYFWAEDAGPDGEVRRTSGDMFFAEVRPFEEIFRQGEQPTGDEQQQMQQGQQGGGQNARQAEELANLQKQIISATWKLIRRETTDKPTDKFVPDVQLLGESQASAKEQATALGERIEDPRSKAYLHAVLTQMDRALAELVRAKDGPAIDALEPALAAEQAAYQALLKLRAREHEVVRANRRQQPQQAGGGGGGNRSQQQLDQLELDDTQNRYETQRSAASLRNPEQAAQQRETRQVLNRLRELAQRQEDLNKQINELQTALDEAKEQAQEEEIRRQLARLRDRQQEILRDTDELRDRMQQEQNQERMAESRQQLDETRENIRRASEALEQGMVTQAAAAGARAGEELNQLQDEFRRATAGQFTEAVNELRDQARQLDETQQQLSEQLTNLDQSSQPSLRDTGDRQEIVKGLGQQKEDLTQLLENMRRTIEEAESTEPLLSKQLYDTVRETRRDQPEQALELSRKLLEGTFVNEARKIAQDAGRGISNLRQGVEKAADSVLGDETEGLRRAERELDSLVEQLNREMNQARGGDNPAEQQASANPQQTGQPQPNGQQPNGQQPNGQQPNGQQPNGQQPNGQQPNGQQPNGQQPNGQQPNGQQPNGQQPNGQQPNGEQPNGQQPNGQQPNGQQPNGEQPNGQPPNGQQGGLLGGARTASGAQRGGGNPTGDLRQFLSGETGPDGNEGPLTGDGFRDWTDRLRDVEEMVGDPRLRAEAARVRDRATAMRAEFNRHSKEPNWDLVQEFIGRPLVELRQAVNEELLKRESNDALVPIDREPVPPEFAEQVRRYYERLGSGR